MSFDEKLRRTAGWCGIVAMILGLMVFAGFGFTFESGSGVRFDTPPVKANVAVCIILAGASLWLQHRQQFVRFGVACAALGLLIPLATLAERALGVDFGVNNLLAADSGGAAAGRMSIHSAIALAGAAMALLCLRPRQPRIRMPISAWLANLLIGTGAAALLALAFTSNDDLTRPLRLSSHVALALIMIGGGVLLARPDDKHVRILFARSAAGVLARRLFIGVAILPVVLSAAVAWLRFNHELSLADGIVLFVIAMILGGFGIALFSVEAAAGINEGREEAEQARILLTARLQEQAAHLQETVNVRTRELRDANASLRAAAESNALLALVAQNTTNGVVITDADGRIEWANPAFARMSGYNLDEVKGRKPGHFLQGPDTDPAAVARLREAEQQGYACNVEILNYTKKGVPFWHIIDLQPVRDSAGRVVNFIANQTDVTDQRADKIRLQHLNQRLELATRAAALGVWEWDAILQKNNWDARTLEIYGLTEDQFTGRREDWTERLHPEDRARAIAAVHAVMNGASSYDQEFRIIRANDQAVRDIQSRAIVQRDEQGRLIRITGTERDITDERAITQQLKTLNERLRLALRSSNYGVWEYDIATGKRHWDERILEIYGLPPGQFDGSAQAWERSFHPEDRAAAVAHVQRAIEGGASDYDLHFRTIRPDGAIRHIEAHGHVQRDASGKAVRLVGLSRDVTERKQLEQALELAEQRWQLAIEGTNDSVWDWDVVTGEVFHDHRWARMLGYEMQELDKTIEGWKALVHPDDLPLNEAAIQAHFAGKTPFYQHELRMRTRDGNWRWILDRGKVVRRGADGRPLRMAGTHTDTTARKELEDRLRKTEELANEVSRLAQIGGWEIDLSNSRVTWTDGTRRIYEVDEHFQPTIETVWQFFPPEGLAIAQSAFQSVTPAEPSFDIEVQLLTARGRRIWVRILGHGEFRAGKAISVHGAIQDVTARRESENSRRELESQLFQAQKMETLGTLAGGIAHDFNNLLTGIIGYHELAADSVPEEHPARACLTEAKNASLRARELVEQILTFGRQTGATEHGPIDLTMVIEEARRFLRATLPANISIEVRCAPNCGVVLADATQIHQVILNLGSNAAHAMRQSGGTLNIRLEPTEVSPDLALTLGGPPANSYVRLSVSDTGHGMDEATRQRIFDPFFTTKNTREGTGLGLAVVHGIVRSHRGAIDVESTPGRGSTFHIYLPTAAEENPDKASNIDSAPRGSGEFVVVVDDEEVVGSCTKLVLESRGYRSLIFASAEQCLAELQNNPNSCAVLVTDQTMPGMQGTELAAAMRKMNPNLPVVIMSGYFSKISPQALDELGQIELLAKPFTTDELAHAVHRALHPAERTDLARL